MLKIKTSVLSLIIICTLSSVSISQTQLDVSEAKTFLKSCDTDSCIAHSLIEVASKFYLLDRDSSHHYNRKALQFAESKSIKQVVCRAKINLGLAELENQNKEKALELINAGIRIALEINDDESLLHGYSNLGIMYHYDVEYSKAVDYYLDAVEISKRLENDYETARLYYNVADVFSQNEIVEKRNDYYKVALKYAGQNPILSALCFIQLSDYHMNNEEDLDSAYFYMDKAFEIEKDIEAPEILFHMYCGKGGILEKELAYVEAYPFYLKAQELAEQLNVNYNLAGCYCLLGNNLNNQNKYEEAEKYFLLFDALNEKVESNYLAKDCYQYWSVMENNRGNYQKSNELLYKHFEIKDSTYSIENRDLVTSYEAKYQAAQKDAELIQKDLQLTRQQVTRNYLISGLGILSLFTFIVIYRFRNKQKLDAQTLLLQKEKTQNLEQKQKLLAMDYMVQGQEEERKRIAKDLHDGLGGILSTAKLQLKNVEKEIEKLSDLKLFQKAEDLIANAHTEVRRIAHDMMPEALMKLGLQSAIEDLALKINMAHDVQIATQLYCPEQILSEQEEVIIYRIVQECLQNVVKHAEAKEILIQLSETEEHVHLTIEDDGVGFDFAEAKAKKGLGLKNLESRVKYLNGQLDVNTSKGNGTSIEILVPK